MSCLINIVGIPLALGLIGYVVFYVIRAQREARQVRREQARDLFDRRKREEAMLDDPWKNNLQDTKFFNDEELL